jgi:hypothetical protein
MKYILRRPNGDEITATRDNLAIRLDNGAVMPDWLVRAEDSPDWITLGDLLASTAPDSTAPETAAEETSQSGEHLSYVAASQEQSPQIFLQSVRCRTCYSTLRSMIDILAALSIIGIVILAGFYIFSGAQDDSTLMVVAGIVVGLLGCFLVIASKQASLLLVDIADTLIEQNRKK